MTMPDLSASDSLHGQYLTLRIGGRLCALPIATVQEIIEYAPLTAIPSGPPYVAGVIDLRGQPLLALDPAQRFFGRGASISAASCIVLLQPGVAPGASLIGLLVDSVHDVIAIHNAKPAELPDLGPDARLEFLEGVISLGGEVVFLLRPEAIWPKAALQGLPTAKREPG